jgi:hypothetical protein
MLLGAGAATVRGKSEEDTVARVRRHGKLQTREARTRLAQSVHPYRHTIQTGLALGYYKGDHAGSWYVRRRVAGRYRVERLSDADDFADADGVNVLDFAQAQRRALLEEPSHGVAPHPNKYTMADRLHLDGRKVLFDPIGDVGGGGTSVARAPCCYTAASPLGWRSIQASSGADAWI